MMTDGIPHMDPGCWHFCPLQHDFQGTLVVIIPEVKKRMEEYRSGATTAFQNHHGTEKGQEVFFWDPEVKKLQKIIADSTGGSWLQGDWVINM